jgi:hypothetical protein
VALKASKRAREMRMRATALISVPFCPTMCTMTAGGPATRSMSRARTDRRISVSMPDKDYDRLVKLQERIEAVSASEVIRHALRALEREVGAEPKSAKGRSR